MSAKKQAFAPVIVRGVSVDGAAVGRAHSALDKAADSLDLAIEANVKQWLLHNNADWLRDLFNSRMLVNQTNGKLKKLGREVADYVGAYTFIQISDKGEGVDVTLTKNKKNKRMLKTGEKDEDGAPVKVEMADDVDLPVTFAEWQAAQRDNEKPEPSNKKAATLASQLDVMMKIVTGEKEGVELIGSMEEVAAMAQVAYKLAEASAVEASKRKAEAEEVEMGAVEQLQGVIGAAEKRAG